MHLLLPAIAAVYSVCCSIRNEITFHAEFIFSLSQLIRFLVFCFQSWFNCIGSDRNKDKYSDGRKARTFFSRLKILHHNLEPNEHPVYKRAEYECLMNLRIMRFWNCERKSVTFMHFKLPQTSSLWFKRKNTKQIVWNLRCENKLSNEMMKIHGM